MKINNVLHLHETSCLLFRLPTALTLSTCAKHKYKNTNTQIQIHNVLHLHETSCLRFRLPTALTVVTCAKHKYKYTKIQIHKKYKYTVSCTCMRPAFSAFGCPLHSHCQHVSTTTYLPCLTIVLKTLEREKLTVASKHKSLNIR